MKYMKIPLYAFEVFLEKDFDGYYKKPINKEIAKNRPDLTFNQIVKSSAKLKEFFNSSNTIYFLADNELFYYSDIFLRLNGKIAIDKRDKVRGAKELYIIKCYEIPNKFFLSKIDKNKVMFELVELNNLRKEI